MAKKDDNKWMDMLDAYKGYLEANHRFPPGDAVFDGYMVGQWLRNQITACHGGFLPENRREMLDAVHPAWKEPAAAKAEAERQMLLASDWRSRVPKGCVPIDVLFQDDHRLALCLRKKIYDVETFFEMGNRLPGQPSVWMKALFTPQNCKAAFDALFPSLNVGYIRLFQGVFGYYGADNFEKACRFFQQHIPSFQCNVEGVLPTLTGQEEMVMRSHYGIDGSEPKSLSEIGREVGLTVGRIRQVEEKALRKLRHPSRVRRMLTDYDSNGDAREQFSPGTGALSSWHYDDNGNCTYHGRSNAYWGDGSDIFWERKTFDENGKMIFHSNSQGYWERAEYNTSGSLMFAENSDGVWERNTYDANNNLVFSDRSDGWWERREYNDDNLLVLLTDSTGRVERYGHRNQGNAELLEMSIDELDLSVRAWHCLARANIRTLGDVIAKTREDLMRVRNMGRRGLDEIEAKLAERGLRLASEFDVEHVPEDTTQKGAKLLGLHISELDLSARAYNCLVRGSLRTVGDVVGQTRDELARIRNMGKISLDEIEAKLAERGLRLAYAYEVQQEPAADVRESEGHDGVVSEVLAEAYDRHEDLGQGNYSAKDKFGLF